MVDEKIKAALIQIVGQQNYTDSLIDMVSYSYDASEQRGRPSCAVWVENTGQVSEVLKLASRESIPVIPRGAGTGLSGLSVPAKGGIVMDLTRMNKILELSIGDRLAVVQPGVVYADLDKALAPYGFFFPPDPSSGKVCTMGGAVGTNAGGIKGAKYGTTRDYVLGLQVVLADGRILRTGGKAIKNVSGYDLTRLLVGSEGTLGVITEITLKINPKPTGTSCTVMATFDDLEDAGRAVGDVMHCGIIPSVLEILGRQTIMAINQNTDLNLPEVDALLLAETDGYTKEETEYQMQKVIEAFRKNNPKEIKQAQSEAEAAAALEGAQVGLRRAGADQDPLRAGGCDGPHRQGAGPAEGNRERSRRSTRSRSRPSVMPATGTCIRRSSTTDTIRWRSRRWRPPAPTCSSWSSNWEGH